MTTTCNDSKTMNHHLHYIDNFSSLTLISVVLRATWEHLHSAHIGSSLPLASTWGSSAPAQALWIKRIIHFNLQHNQCKTLSSGTNHSTLPPPPALLWLLLFVLLATVLPMTFGADTVGAAPVAAAASAALTGGITWLTLLLLLLLLLPPGSVCAAVSAFVRAKQKQLYRNKILFKCAFSLLSATYPCHAK